MRGLLLSFAFIFSFSANAQERILSFNSQVQIGANGQLTVLETIIAQVEGQQIKRGILRDFPTDYQDRLGRKVTVPFDVVSVRRDGQSEAYALTRQKNGVSVRIGNASVMLPRGRHVYEIIYTTNFQVGFFDTHDELYWNVNGNGWTFAMDEISAEVSLPSAVPAGELKVEAYTGPFGAKGRDYTASTHDGGASFRTTKRMQAGEGLTLVFMFPKGIVAPPTLRQKFDRWLKDNTGEAVDAAGLLVFLAFLYWRWAAVGRDPRAGPLFPRYEAPTGIGPAGVRYLDKMACDDRCFASALLDLGQRGYLRIKEDGGVYELERTGKSVDWLPGEAAVAVLAPAQGVRGIGAAYDPAVEQARAALDIALKAHFDEKLFSLNRGPVALAALFGGALIVLSDVFLHTAQLVTFGVLAVMLVALVFAWKLLPAYTVEGRRLEDEVEGLRQYLSVAEGDEIARMKMPPRTKEEFARFLPYAVALEVEKTWAEAFAKVLGAAALAQATAGYYSTSSSDGYSNSGHFVDSIKDMGTTISSASSPPSSSSGGSDSGGGGGGGGSSGGGGGGGGGSGW